MSAVLTTQRDAARAIAGCVAKALKPASAGMPPPVAPEMVQAYLKARIEFDKMSAEGIGKALQYCREMNLKAPDFALGLCLHAACLFMMGYWGHAPVSEVYPSAKHLALQALAIDDSLAGAHLALAWMKLLLDWDLDAAMREVRRTIELSPSETDAHSFYLTLLCFVGQKSEAMREVEYMLKLNPTSLLPNQYAAWMCFYMGQHERAEEQAKRTIALFPDSLQHYFVLGWSAWYQGRAEEAVAALEKALSHSREALSISYLGHIYGRIGQTDEARRLFREFEQLRARSFSTDRLRGNSRGTRRH
jgi:tetratricopeptide (TPR) repeat protein